MIAVDYINNRVARVNQYLDLALPHSESEPFKLNTAMRYVVLNGGKRLRPLLVYATGESLNVDISHLDAAACAVEFIHAYSLVHDDLPAMDNDDFRRGQPSCHKAFDEATAILVGDALQTLAFSTLLTSTQQPQQILAQLEILTIASGGQGMVAGQSLELTLTRDAITVEQLERIHQLKTGALIRAAVLLGAVAANADVAVRQALEKYANAIGLAFQIQDDLQDLACNVKEEHSLSYPQLVGEQVARNKVKELYELAMSQLDILSNSSTPLHTMTQYVIPLTN